MPRAVPETASLTQDTYERLRADLLACRRLPGARLKIADLCGDLSVSLSAVREALARLTSDGLVVADPQRGFRVAPISTSELNDLTDVRCRIEGMCLERALDVGDVAWESMLVGAYHQLSRTPERDPSDPQRLNDAWSAAHASFHEALVGACDSPWLLRLRATLFTQAERYRRWSIPLAETTRDLDGEHRAIMDSALTRDVARTTLLMERHIKSTTRILLKTL